MFGQHANFSSGVSVFNGTSWSVINPGNFILSCDFDIQKMHGLQVC